MHELGIANAVLETVRAQAARHPGARLVRVGVRVGALAGVDPEALAFSFQALTAGTTWEKLALDIESCPRRHRCASCGHTFAVPDYRLSCPACGESRTECVGGQELEVAYLELEEP